MISLGILIGLQLVIALIVVIVLKQQLDRELEKAAIEKMMSIRNNPETKMVNVYFAKSLPNVIEQQIRSLGKTKFSNAQMTFESLEDLRGGLMIKIDQEVLDFSLSSRLENFWS
jgi:F0F1-type ATP synthase delta subunit